ncbi:MAG: hypothetical protein GY937_28590 [bacterium]|nr:hypothetical protein [bacterium]
MPPRRDWSVLEPSLSFRDEAALRRVIPAPGRTPASKKRDRLDPATARSPDERRIRIRAVAPELARLLQSGTGIGALFMIPGFDETLRLNGHAEVIGEDAILRVDEVYLYCPKAFLRSGLWTPTSMPPPPHTLRSEERQRQGDADLAFLAEAPFAFLGTSSTEDAADVSPRGDPPDFVRALADDLVLLPDRPGNRIADSFRNRISDSSMALLVVQPGTAEALHLAGRGGITSDTDLLLPSAIRGRSPRLGIRLAIETVMSLKFEHNASSLLWHPSSRLSRETLPNLGRLLVGALDGSGAHKLVIGWLVERLIQRDATKNLY